MNWGSYRTLQQLKVHLISSTLRILLSNVHMDGFNFLPKSYFSSMPLQLAAFYNPGYSLIILEALHMHLLLDSILYNTWLHSDSNDNSDSEPRLSGLFNITNWKSAFPDMWLSHSALLSSQERWRTWTEPSHWAVAGDGQPARGWCREAFYID